MKQTMRYLSILMMLVCSIATWADDRVVIVTPENGTVKPDNANPKGTVTVTLTVTPKAGEYFITLDDILVEKTSAMAQTRAEGPAIVETIEVKAGSVDDTGKGTYTFALSDGYGARVSATFTECATFTPVVTIKGWMSGEAPNSPSVGDTNKSGGAVTYTYATKGTTSFSATVPTEAGDYTVKASIAAKGHYKAAEATADFTIEKAPEPEPEPEPEPQPEKEIVDKASPVSVDGETFYKLTSETKELVKETILANIALPATANLNVTITPEGSLGFKAGTDTHVAIRHLKVGDVIQFFFTGRLFGNSSWLSLLRNAARSGTRAMDDLELVSGAYYSIMQEGDMIVTIKAGEVDAFITAIILSPKEEQDDPDPDPDPDPTGINTIEGDSAPEIWYDLQGRRITPPQRPGLYIRNGRKVLLTYQPW